MSAVLQYLPRGSTLSDEAYDRRHRLLQAVLLIHLPLLFAFGLWRGFGPGEVAEALAAPAACLVLGHLMRSRRPASLFVTLGLVYCSAALVGFSGGAIEAHFHFFIMIGFIALYQDWVPFLVNVLFTVLSHGIGSSFGPGLMFNHPAAQSDPWLWSLIHGVAVLAACVGVVLFWKTSEEEQQRSMDLARRLSEAELGRRRFTSDLLVNLARRNQNLLYRQLDLINNLEEKERDPDALSDLFQLDHLATRIRRNAENLLVLSGEDTPRSWSAPVPLVDVVRAAIAEIEDLDRADLAVDEDLAVSGRVVADLTHLLAELLENAVHFSPPGVSVMVRSRPNLQDPGAQVLTIEDWGVGMGPDEVADANGLLAAPQDVDLSVSQRLGLHVVARLAARNGTSVTLTPTPGGGVTAAVMLPPSLFTQLEAEPVPDAVLSAPAARVGAAMRVGAAVREPAAVRVGAAVRDPAAVRPAYGRELPEAWGDSSAPAAPPLPPALPTVAALPDAGALAGRAGDAGALPRRSPGRAARDLDRPFGAPRRDARGTGEEDSGQDGWAAWWTP
ncbi:MAG TPA: ATP-binding protein, partial [Mycobacteriales bacterium]